MTDSDYGNLKVFDYRLAVYIDIYSHCLCLYSLGIGLVYAQIRYRQRSGITAKSGTAKQLKTHPIKLPLI